VEGAADLVLAAFAGAEAFKASLDRQESAAFEAEQLAAPSIATYLAAIEVEGFRGIGPPVTLSLEPSPGLTLVVGRNGSGKSSFAEALEMLLTGSNRRWTERAKVWQDGWRNLHHGPPRITGRFRPDGQRTPMTVERRWASDADVAGSVLTIDGKHRDLEENGWSRALESWPPLLSHNELGRILEGRPSELYDALAKILGLGEIAAAETVLRDTRVEADRQIRDQERQTATLLGQLDGLDDERARNVAEALRQKPWDLPAVERAISSNPVAVEERSALTRLRELSTLPVLLRERVDVAVGQLREVGHELERLRGTDAALARETAALLRQALQVHEAGHEGTDCPVCGAPGVITYQWKLQAGERIEQLEAQASSVAAVHQRARQLLLEARQLVSAPPPVLREAAEVGVDADQALTYWAVWGAAPEGDDVIRMAAHLEGGAPPLIGAVAAVRGAAAAELERREDRWRPVGRALAVWLPGAQLAEEQRARLPRLKAAEAWLKSEHERLREQRFAPIAAQVQAHWQDLRQSSSVQLGQLHLEGTGTSTQRRLSLDSRSTASPVAPWGS
jgi:energy-coupling factor transporter ATP-binding protein EcfA2